MGDKPSMLEFRSFPAESGNMDLALLISTEYKEVGRCLLEDESGARISAIESNQNGNIKNINDEIFQEWKKGSGKMPVTWETVLVCLRQAGLVELANDIKEGLEGVADNEEPATPPTKAKPTTSKHSVRSRAVN